MDEKPEKIEPDPGGYPKGMKISIPSFSISIGEDGGVVSDPVTLLTGLDMSPYWLEIAYQHLFVTEEAHTELMAAKAKKMMKK